MDPVRMEGVCRTFGAHPAVVDVDLTVGPGETVGLLGPNGAGKSTLIALMLGLDEPDSGSVRLFGSPPDDRGRARVGWIPEARTLPTMHRVRAALELMCRVRGARADEASRTASEWLERLDLVGKANDRIGALSNGQQQRVQIAIALMGRPSLVVADEPMTALDLTHQLLVWELFREAVAGGAALVVCTHRLLEAQGEVGRVVLMRAGRVVADGTLEALREHPDEPLEALFLRATASR